MQTSRSWDPEAGPNKNNEKSDGVQSIVALIDDRRLRRNFFQHALNSLLSGHAITLHSFTPEAISSVRENGHKPKYQLVILNLGAMTVEEAVKSALMDNVLSAFDDAHVVILSDRDDSQEVRAAFRAGAKAFVGTNLAPELVANILVFVLEGGSYYPPAALLNEAGPSAKPVQATPMPPRNDDPDAGNRQSLAGMEFTVRQKEVIVLLQQGLANKVIARHLGMTEATVKVHVRQIMRRLGVSNRTQVALQLAALENDRRSSQPRPAQDKVRQGAGHVAVHAVPN